MIIHTYTLFCFDPDSSATEAWQGKKSMPLDMQVTVFGKCKESVIEQWKSLGFDKMFKAKSIQGFGEAIYLNECDQFHITKGIFYAKS